MKYVCLGYIEPGKLENLPEKERIDVGTPRRAYGPVRNPAGRGPLRHELEHSMRRVLCADDLRRFAANGAIRLAAHPRRP